MSRSGQHPEDEEEEQAGAVSPARLLAAVRTRWRFVATVTVLVAALVAGIVWGIPNRYDASAVVQIDPRKKTISNMEGVLSELRADSTTVESEVEIVKSRAIALRVIDILGLRDDEEFTGPPALQKFAAKIGIAHILPPEINTARSSAPRDAIADLIGDKPGESNPERDAVAVAFLDKLKVSRVRNTLLIEIKYSSRDPVKAARIANTVAEVYLSDQLEQKSRAAGAATGLLEEKLADLKAKLTTAESKVEQFKAAHSIFDSNGHALSEQQLTKLMEQTLAARSSTAEARARFEQVKKLVSRGGDGGGTFGDVLQSQTIRQMKEQLGAAQRREAELMTKYGPNHPDMRKVRAEVQEARANLDAEMDRLVASVRNEYEVAEERERQLTYNLNALKAQEMNVKSASIELRELEREAATSKQLFEALLARYKQTAETQGLQLPDARIVEKADAPLYPAFPKRKQLTALGLLGGLALGLALAVLLEMMTPGIERLDDVEHALDVPHLSSLPQTDLPGIGRTDQRKIAAGPETLRAMRLVVADPGGIFADAIRSMRREIDIRRQVGAPRVILVASSLPGEGSAVVASNLAHHYAVTGSRVLLVDGDLRRAGLSKQLAAQRPAGLAEALSAGVPVEHGVLRDATTGLHFLPAMGPAPVRHTNPEMLQGPHMQAVLASLKRQFDTIVIDAPPLLPVIDGRILADHADQIVLVVAWRRTARQMARRAVKSLGFNQAKVLGAVVTEVDASVIAAAEGLPQQRLPHDARLGRAA